MVVSEEFRRLKGTHYLDHAGATLYSEKQVEAVMRDLCSSLYCNPHSSSTISKQTSDVIDQIRYRVLRHFNTNMDEYDIIFTGGATEALKLVAESFNFGHAEKGVFLYTQENHTSVLGMREVVSDRSSSIICMPSQKIAKLFSTQTEESEDQIKCNIGPGNSLFVMSGQCNFSGAKTPLSWVEMAQAGKLNQATNANGTWSCLLDAASLVTTSHLDLALYKPDFVTISFYKIFGFPTGLGALLVKNTSSYLLSERKYFGGGTVLMAMSTVRKYKVRQILHERFEDGTLSFLSVLAVGHGLDTLARLMGSMNNIRQHTFSLARRTHHSLKVLRHYNNTPVAILYCDNEFEDPNTQGAIVCFNLLRPDRKYVGYNKVLNMANSHKIQLRTGCFCNPGACQRHLGLTEYDLQTHFEAGHVCGDTNDLVGGVPTGAVRVSFGYMSTENDVNAFLDMIYQCFVESKAPYRAQETPEVWHDATDDIKSMHTFKGSVPAKLSQVVLYPIKSCGGFKPNKYWWIGPRGLIYDRMWMVVTPKGTALTQSLEPKLALVRPHIDLTRKLLKLEFSGQPGIIAVPLDEKNDDELINGSLCQSKVCGDRIKAADCGDEVALWLSSHLGRHGIRLVRQLQEDGRSKKDAQKALALSNKAQFLMINQASVSWLGEQIDPQACEKAGLVDRFRANLIIDGLSPFVEKDWMDIVIGTQRFTVDGPCTRCGVVCVDQATGEKTNEPLRTLSSVSQHNVNFGMYLSHHPDGDDDGIGLISCGNIVTILKSKCPEDC